MAITLSAGFAPEAFENSPVWEKVELVATADEGDYNNTVSAEYGTRQISLKGYKGFYTIPSGFTSLHGTVEIWKCKCIRATDYTTVGDLSYRAFEK